MSNNTKQPMNSKSNLHSNALSFEAQQLKQLCLDVPFFPQEIFKPAIESYLKKQTQIKECDIGTLSMMFIGLAAVAIGGAKSVVMGTWEQRAILWIAMVGRAGVGKTQVLNSAGLDVLDEIQGSEVQKYRQELKVFESRLEAWELMSREEKQSEKKPEEPEFPKQTHSKIITTEAILEVNDLVPLGVAAVNDELASILDSKNQYKGGRGNDQPLWLDFWNGSEIFKNRCGGKILHIPSPFICMIGGIQPRLLKKIINVKNIDDGFASRVLPVFFQEPSQLLSWRDFQEIEKSITHSEQEAIRTVFERLIEQREVETVYQFSTDAEAIIREHQEKLNRIAKDSDDYISASIRKLRTYLLRFALVIHCIKGESGNISVLTALQACAIIDYLHQNIEKAFSIVFHNDREENQSLILEKIKTSTEPVTRANIKQRLKRRIPFGKCGILIEQLIGIGLLREVQDSESKKIFIEIDEGFSDNLN